MTRTTTSNAPGSGTSISSSWNASRGSPSRSRRITHADIVSGRVPGSTPISLTFATSTAMSGSVLRVESWRIVARAPGHSSKTRDPLSLTQGALELRGELLGRGDAGLDRLRGAGVRAYAEAALRLDERERECRAHEGHRARQRERAAERVHEGVLHRGTDLAR